MRRIHIDLSHSQGANPRRETFCVSASRAYTLLMESHRAHLSAARRECGFRYVRFHGLFQDDMGVYREDAFGNPVWGWQYVDEVYDFLMDIGLRPFVVLDYMPEALKSGEKTIYWEKANITPPNDSDKWYRLIYRTVCHFRDRYGEDEVSEWFFEVWNEPDGFFWTGSRQDYFALYESAARAVKAACPRFRVGGPSVAGNADWMDALAEFCRERAVPLDFFSGHSYCLKPFLPENKVHPQPGLPVWSPGTAWPLGNAAYDPKGGEESIARYAQAAKRADLPLYITEFGLSYDYWDPLRDSYQAASWLLSRLRANREKALCFSICEVSDVFEEDGPPTQASFHGGFGLINLQGIRKSAYFALKFLGEMFDFQALCDDERCWATFNKGGRASILFYDDTAKQSADNRAAYARPAAPASLGQAELTVSGLSGGRYELVVTRVGYRENDPYSAFLEMGGPERDSLSREEVAALMAGADGSPWRTNIACVGDDGVLTVSLPLRENDVYQIKLAPCKDERRNEDA